jgi:hypothetical protein
MFCVNHSQIFGICFTSLQMWRILCLWGYWNCAMRPYWMSQRLWPRAPWPTLREMGARGSWIWKNPPKLLCRNEVYTKLDLCLRRAHIHKLPGNPTKADRLWEAMLLRIRECHLSECMSSDEWQATVQPPLSPWNGHARDPSSWRVLSDLGLPKWPPTEPYHK